MSGRTRRSLPLDPVAGDRVERLVVRPQEFGRLGELGDDRVAHVFRQAWQEPVADGVARDAGVLVRGILAPGNPLRAEPRLEGGVRQAE